MSSTTRNDQEISNIESECLTDSSKKRYASSNFELVTYLHKNNPDMVRPGLKRQLDHAEAHFPPKKKKKEMKKIVDGWFNKMDRSDVETCPIDMEKMSYKIIASFMVQKKNKHGKYFTRSVYDGI